MLNDAQRNSLSIVMTLVEEKMRAVEFKLAHPNEQALMFEVHNDVSSDVLPLLQEKIAEVARLIQTLRDRLALHREIRWTSRQLITGLAQLWVYLQESDSKGLRRFGDVAPAVSPALDNEIDQLAHLMLEMEEIVLKDGRPLTGSPP